NADWKPEETTELIKFLVDNMHERTSNASTGFKDVVYKQAADKIAPLLQVGPKKTSAMCKTKWNSLKGTYSIITKLKNLSGFSWDDQKGVDVTEDTQLQWD
ncbi:hypothetical protein BGW80DRAFT_1132378, partial [Lactifluus volemus]